MKLAAVLVVGALGTAQADNKPADEPEPDQIADDEATEANLEPRDLRFRHDVNFAGALGFGISLGGDIGVGQGLAGNLRIAAVATKRDMITWEIVTSSALHKRAVMAMPSETLTDLNLGLFTGVQRYLSRLLWIRAAGGLAILTKDIQTDGSRGATMGGFGGLVGGGVGVMRLGYFMLSVESFAMPSVTRDGVKVSFGLFSGLTYY